jgi:hypothetical protein
MSWISYLVGRFSGVHRWPVLGVHRGLPVQTFCVIRDCAHDSKIVGTISLRRWKCHAASAAGVAENKFHGSSSAIRLMG